MLGAVRTTGMNFKLRLRGTVARSMFVGVVRVLMCVGAGSVLRAIHATDMGFMRNPAMGFRMMLCAIRAAGVLWCLLQNCVR